MRQIKFILLVLILTNFYFSSAQSLQNGGFETSLTNWKITDDTNCKAQIVSEDSTLYGKILPKEGKQFLKVTIDSSKTIGCKISNMLIITPQRIGEFNLSFSRNFISTDTNAFHNWHLIFYSKGVPYRFEYLAKYTVYNNSIWGDLNSTINLKQSGFIINDNIDSIQFNITFESEAYNASTFYLDNVQLGFKVAGMQQTHYPEFKLYPNPTRGNIDVTGFDYTSAVISTIDGKIMNIDSNNIHNKLDISTLPNGLYFIRLENDTEFVYKKILKY